MADPFIKSPGRLSTAYSKQIKGLRITRVSPISYFVGRTRDLGYAILKRIYLYGKCSNRPRDIRVFQRFPVLVVELLTCPRSVAAMFVFRPAPLSAVGFNYLSNASVFKPNVHKYYFLFHRSSPYNTS